MRYKCTLKPGVEIDRGEGTKPDEFIYVYGDGPWGMLSIDDLATRVECPIESETTTMQEGRAAPGK